MQTEPNPNPNPQNPTSVEATRHSASPGDSPSVAAESLGLGAPTEEPKTPSSSEREETKPAPKLEPFSDEEILSGVAIVASLGLRPESKAEVEAFQESFFYIIPPVLQTSQILAPLRLGEALATYGIGKGMLPGSNGLDALPGWARLALGGVVMAVATVGGVRASRQVRNQMAGEGPEVGNSGAGSGGAHSPAQ